MAEKDAAKPYVSPQVNPYGHVDEEVSEVAKEQRRKKRMKWFVYILAFTVFQIGIITLFGMTVMKVKTPKFRVRSATFDTFEVSTANTNPSFNIMMNAELGVKNTNFGHYKYRNSTIEFYYMGTKVGEAFVPRARARARSTRKFNVTVSLSSSGVPSDVLANEFRTHAVIPLTSQSRLRGKIELMKVMKKNKSSNMNCTMDINISTSQLQNIRCR